MMAFFAFASILWLIVSVCAVAFALLTMLVGGRHN